jgi:hypothetical protein
MRCELAPGQRLIIEELARRLRVSAMPVREALHLLRSEGLVVNVPHVGATAAPIAPPALHEVFTIEGLEIVAAREAAVLLGPRDADELQGILEIMDEALGTGAYARWSSLNSRFHLTISAVTVDAAPARHDRTGLRAMGPDPPSLLRGRPRPPRRDGPARAPRAARCQDRPRPRRPS